MEEEFNEFGELILPIQEYGQVDKPCPWCQGLTLVEDTYGYEKVISCSHCEYSVSKTI